MNSVVFLITLVHKSVSYVLGKSLGALGCVVTRLKWHSILGLLFALCGGLFINTGLFFESFYLEWAEFNAKQIKAVYETNSLAYFNSLSLGMQGIGALMCLLALLAIVRVRPIHFLMKVSASASLLLWIWLYSYIIGIPSALLLIEVKPPIFDKDFRNELWVNGTGLWVLGLALVLSMLLCVMLRVVCIHYGSSESLKELVYDRIAHSLRTHGIDPRFRKSGYWAFFIHFFLLIIYPLLYRGCMMDPYAIPKGSGTPNVQKVKVKKVKKKKEDQIVFNMNSAISFYKPEIDESQVMEEVDEVTENTYEASALKSGKLGKGGGKKGGWPNGMDGKVRFIRLEYSGGDWDQDMGKGSDYNFLIKFKEMTGFKIASNTEAIKIFQLSKFPKHRSPPFVYITGKGGINISRKEAKILKNYLLVEGGMIFADNGGGSFNRSFKGMMKKVLPDKKWVTIANDDIIFRQPYLFPNGAPPLAAHSGSRALGLKHNGRWIAFYHQGDINDAWKSNVSGLSPAVQSAAFKMGVNVVNYAFTQYLSQHFGEE